MTHFGERLRQSREKASLSQEKLGILIEASRQQVHAWEKQENAPNGETLKKFAVALGVTADYLLGLSDNPQAFSSEELSSDERRALSLWRRGDKFDAIKVIVGDKG